MFYMVCLLTQSTMLESAHVPSLPSRVTRIRRRCRGELCNYDVHLLTADQTIPSEVRDGGSKPSIELVPGFNQRRGRSCSTCYAENVDQSR